MSERIAKQNRTLRHAGLMGPKRRGGMDAALMDARHELAQEEHLRRADGDSAAAEVEELRAKVGRIERLIEVWDSGFWYRHDSEISRLRRSLVAQLRAALSRPGGGRDGQ